MNLKHKIRREDANMESLKGQYQYLYQQPNTEGAQPQLQWEQLWAPPNNDYGRFSQMSTWPHHSAHAQGHTPEVPQGHVQSVPQQSGSQTAKNIAQSTPQVYYDASLSYQNIVTANGHNAPMYSPGVVHHDGVLPPVSTLLSIRSQSHAPAREIQNFPVSGPTKAYVQNSYGKFCENNESIP